MAGPEIFSLEAVAIEERTELLPDHIYLIWILEFSHTFGNKKKYAQTAFTLTLIWKYA